MEEYLPYAIPALITLLGNYAFKWAETKGIISKKRLDDKEAENVAFELSEKYGKKVLELEARLTLHDNILNGDLDLRMKVPMGDLVKNGTAPFTGTAYIIRKQ